MVRTPLAGDLLGWAVVLLDIDALAADRPAGDQFRKGDASLTGRNAPAKLHAVVVFQRAGVEAEAVSHRPLIAITMGDPAGIGPEICLKAIATSADAPFATILFGDAGVLARAAAEGDLSLPRVAGSLSSAEKTAASCGAAILDLPGLPVDWRPGQVDAATGAAAYRYVTNAIEAALSRRVGGVVTGPLHKEALRSAGVPYPGHTEIFESLTASPRACMMLTSDQLSCSFVTTHVGLCDVPGLLSVERVLDVIEMTEAAMRKIRRRRPRLVVLGLNPHAGEQGLFGQCEEERFIIPAIERARESGIQVDGPLPPDTAFLPARRRETDAFVCMYHDQGHIPLKALSFETAVNTTLGLPIVRTSVDHGTALDIAWQGFQADQTSMLQALRLAAMLASDRGDAERQCSASSDSLAMES